MAARNRVIVNCAVCGKPISLQPSELAKGRKHCSRECLAVAQRQIPKESHPNWKGGQVKRICEQCGKPFRVDPNVVRNGGGRFCSRRCLADWQSVDGDGGQETITCKQCGKQFQSRIYTERRFCSRECYGQWLSENRSLENHHNWRGGISFEPYPVHWQRDLKEKIRRWEGHRCAICGQTQERALSVHHIDYDKCNLAEENLIALCISCHTKTNYQRDCWQYWLSAGIVPEMMEMAI